MSITDEEKVIKVNALKLAVEFSVGYNHDLETYTAKCSSTNTLQIANKFEKYLRGENV